MHASDGTPGSGDWGWLEVDLSNTFNSLRRQPMLDGAIRRCPEAGKWLQFCYGTHTPLY